MQDNISSLEEREFLIQNKLVSMRDNLTEEQKSWIDVSVDIDHGTPYFKIKHFVGDAQITSFHKYKQFILELRAREEIIENLLMNIARQEAMIEVIYEEMNDISSNAKMKLKEFDLITNKNDLLKLHRRLKQAYNERNTYVEAIQEMYDSGEAYLPDGTDMKLALSDEKKMYELEAEHWKYRLGKQAALDMISTGKIGVGNMEAISMLSESDQVDTLNVAIGWASRVDNALGEIQKTVLKELENKSFNISLTKPQILEIE